MKNSRAFFIYFVGVAFVTLSILLGMELVCYYPIIPVAYLMTAVVFLGGLLTYYVDKWSSEDERHKTETKRCAIPAILIFVSILVGVLLASTYIIWQEYNSWPRISLTLDRHPLSGPEYSALQVAEAANYSEILSWTPYWDGEDTIVPDPKWETWINYINNETLEYLLYRVETIPQLSHRSIIELNYTARSIWMTNLTVNVDNFGEKISLTNQTNTMTFSWCNSNLDSSRIATWNGTDFESTTGYGYQAIAGSYGDAFFIYMNGIYSENRGPLAGFATGVEQIVIMNNTHQILLVATINMAHFIS
jgi:hypothetical protein